VLGNGSNELIELLVRAFLRPGDEAVVPHPSFVVYPMIVQAAGGIRVMVMLKDYKLDLDAMARAITPMTKLVFIANPNNPTATMVTADEVEAFMHKVPERTIVVFDEAYIEFALGPDFPDSLAYVKQGRKVVVLRTFSKAASLAGLRVGYAVADPDAISLMNRIRQPFNVNSLAQAAALAALEDESHILECVRMIEAGRHYLYDEFKALGLKYVPARANFILVDVGRSAADIYQKLLLQGVIVRPMTSFGMESALRVTVGTPEENRRLIKALKTVLGSKSA
jgi:histidinol-phosphate aminotransferase